MPPTEFDSELKCSDGHITVAGPIGDPDDPVHRAIVCAFVTQKLKDGHVATVAGESILYPVARPVANGHKWWLLRPEQQIEPPEPRPEGDTPEVPETHSYTYDMKRSHEWSFKAALDAEHPFTTGPAFGTAVMLTFKQDGSIETYAWSGWLDIKA